MGKLELGGNRDLIRTRVIYAYYPFIGGLCFAVLLILRTPDPFRIAGILVGTLLFVYNLLFAPKGLYLSEILKADMEMKKIIFTVSWIAFVLSVLGCFLPDNFRYGLAWMYLPMAVAFIQLSPSKREKLDIVVDKLLDRQRLEPKM